ncbi:unnamed protein product, partial [Strongylus vulgaris]
IIKKSWANILITDRWALAHLSNNSTLSHHIAFGPLCNNTAQVEMRAWINYLVLGLGVALTIAGSVMLGVGISRSNSSKNCKTTTDVPFTKAAPTTPIPTLTTNRPDVHKVSYDVLLSYPPDASNPNYMTIEDPNGTVIFKSEGISPPIISAEQSDKGAGMQWLAFSPNGTVRGDVVYCGFATEKEFQILQSLGVNVTNKIALIRYGGTFRGDKVAMAQKYGAIGAILYSDPAEVAPHGTTDGNKIMCLSSSITSSLTHSGDFTSGQGNCHKYHRQIQNVIGYINGAEEPERYIILGNHYDAWTYGAMDPNAGTAVLAEVARATVATMKMMGWRPGKVETTLIIWID